MRALAMTGIVTVAMISLMGLGLAMRATPPSARIMAGTRSRAMTEMAPASSAMRACSTFMTSMMTPPLSISARPILRRSEDAGVVLVVPLLVLSAMVNLLRGVSNFAGVVATQALLRQAEAMAWGP